MGSITTMNLMAMAVIVIIAAASTTAAAAYTNHTVGGAAGWLFNAATNTSSTNYTSWSNSQAFSLGDYLIFNTTSNQTVVQTLNETTYRSCTTDDSSGNDTSVYEGGNNSFDQALTVEVPLIFEGVNYFFSDADDGEQCQRGMAFQIVVSHGQGLPPSLNQPPPPPYKEPPSADNGGPVVTVPSGPTKSDSGRISIVANMLAVMVCVLFMMLV